MRQEESREIDGETYLVRMLDPDTAIDLLIDLFDMLGDALSAVIRVDMDDGEAQEKAIGIALRLLVGKVEKAKVHAAITALSKVSDVNGKPLAGVYKVHFMGRIGTLAKWLVFALQVQYSDFTDAFGHIPILQTPPQRSGNPEGNG